MKLQDCLDLKPNRFVFWWSHGSTSTHSINIGVPALRAAGYKGVIEIVCIMLADAGDFKTEHTFECGIFCEMK